jgi:hypothetical protein
MVDYITKNILIPIKLTKDKHKQKEQWIKCYYYVDKKRTSAIINKNVSTSKMDIRKNTFYKCNQLSKNDEVFDYYRIIKREIANNPKIKEIGKINKLKNNSSKYLAEPRKIKERIDTSWKGKKVKGISFDYSGRIINWN